MNHIENSFSTHESPSKEKLEHIKQMAKDGAWDPVLVEVENLLMYFPNSPFTWNERKDALFQFQ